MHVQHLCKEYPRHGCGIIFVDLIYLFEKFKKGLGTFTKKIPQCQIGLMKSELDVGSAKLVAIVFSHYFKYCILSKPKY